MTTLSNLSPIYESEWQGYEWWEVTALGDECRTFARGKRRTPPPQDGYHYERKDGILDDEYKWERVYERNQ